MGGRKKNYDEGWRLVASSNRRTAPALSADLHLQNRLSALVAAKGTGAPSSKAVEPAEPDSAGFILENHQRREWKGLRRSGQILQITTQQHASGIKFYDYRTLSEGQQLLGKDRIHLTKWGKSDSAKWLANMARRALN